MLPVNTRKFYKKHKTQINAILKLVYYNKSFVVFSHAIPDGDAIGSEVAWGKALKNLGKKVRIFNEDGASERFQKMTGSRLVKTSPDKTGAYDVCFILDTATFDRIGKNSSNLVNPDGVTVNIDHHQSNRSYAKNRVDLVDTEASATGVMIYHLVQIMEHNFQQKIFDLTICEAIYCAISTDTGSFLYGNTNAVCHEIVADLMSRGTNTQRINNYLYASNPMRRVLLLKEMLKTIEFHANVSIASMCIFWSFNQKLQLKNTDSSGMIQHIRDIDGVKVAITFSGIEKNKTRISFRSKSDNVDVNKLASIFNGGGHKQAAGATIDKPVKLAKKEVIKKTQDWMLQQGHI